MICILFTAVDFVFLDVILSFQGVSGWILGKIVRDLMQTQKRNPNKLQRRDVAIIDCLALDGVRPDILLLGSPTGIGPEIGHGIREACLEARRLKPRAVFAFGHEPLERSILA